MKNRDLYKTLSVSSDSEDVVINAAYKALMLKYHPDKSSHADATVKAAEINEAYAILGDPEKRAAYDRENGYSRSETQHERPSEPPDASEAKDNAETTKQKLKPTMSAAKWGLWLSGSVIAGVFCVALLIDASRSSSEDYSAAADSDYSSPATDAVAFETNESTQPGDDLTSSTNLDLIGSTEFELPPAAKTTLGPLSSLSYPDIEMAVVEFDRVLSARGIMGAKSYSIKCHEAAKEIVEWSKYDFCVAFDFAAAQLDSAIAKKNGSPPNAYFSFMSENASDQYVGAQWMSYQIKPRVSSIERAVRPALLETISARIAKDTESASSTSTSVNAAATTQTALIKAKEE